MKSVRDQMNLTIRLEYSPSRIVSLVPSQTQLLHYLGLEDEVVGITKFCIIPDEWYRSKTRVGGTKSVDLKKVKSLRPDLIIGNKEENSIEDVVELRKIAPVWMSDIYTLEDALYMIKSIAEITDRVRIGSGLIEQIKQAFAKMIAEIKPFHLEGKTVLYYIWKEPNMISGKSTFVDDMISKCGLVNATNLERYPEINAKDYSPDYIFLSSEPYPFKQEHIDEFQPMYPNSKIVLVDGEMFSWYGSKLKDAPAYFTTLLRLNQ